MRVWDVSVRGLDDRALLAEHRELHGLFNVLTLGLFTFAIIGALVMLVAALVPGFKVASFWWALGFALILAVVNSALHALTRT
jgi:uncharacterized membrane protein YvlD (DUF360 family)